jgi:DoxX-like family
MIWTGFIMSLLPVLMLLTGAVMSILNPTAVGEAMGKMGYPATLAVTLGTVELLCTVLYLIPQTSILGAILLTGYLGGATATHVRVSEPFFLPILFGVLVWGGIYLRNPRLRALIPFRR